MSNPRTARPQRQARNEKFLVTTNERSSGATNTPARPSPSARSDLAKSHWTRSYHNLHPRPRDDHRSPRSAEATSAIRKPPMSRSRPTVTPRASIDTAPSNLRTSLPQLLRDRRGDNTNAKRDVEERRARHPGQWSGIPRPASSVANRSIAASRAPLFPQAFLRDGHAASASFRSGPIKCNITSFMRSYTSAILHAHEHRPGTGDAHRGRPLHPPARIARLPTPVLFSPSPHAERRFWEFFTAHIRNPNTRLAYPRARTGAPPEASGGATWMPRLGQKGTSSWNPLTGTLPP